MPRNCLFFLCADHAMWRLQTAEELYEHLEATYPQVRTSQH